MHSDPLHSLSSYSALSSRDGIKRLVNFIPAVRHLLGVPARSRTPVGGQNNEGYQPAQEPPSAAFISKDSESTVPSTNVITKLGHGLVAQIHPQNNQKASLTSDTQDSSHIKNMDMAHDLRHAHDAQYIEELFTMSGLISGLSAIFMIIGGALPYIPQYMDISKTENADGFSLYVCLTLLIANTLRIVFWFGNPFEIPLLLQSIVMNLAMLSLVELCVRVRSHTTIVPAERQRYFLDFEMKYFWRWTDFSSYLEFMGVFALLSGLAMYALYEVPYFVECVGYLALIIEAMLGTPQVLKNFQNRSTYGMSLYMIGGWILGDLYKCCYFYLREAPAQFLVCGTLQVTIDLIIVIQVLYYGRRVPVATLTAYSRVKTTEEQL